MRGWSEWRQAQAHRQRALQYVRALPEAPESAELAWLTTVAGHEPVARQELRWLRWAISRLVAERDAMDDRTAAEVARALDTRAREARAAGAEEVNTAMWSARWAAYAEAMGRRGTVERWEDRLAAVLLASAAGGAGRASPAGDSPDRARALVVRYWREANAALRAAFGTVSLPDNVRPSALHG